MSEFNPAPASGAADRGAGLRGGGTPPPVLLGALAAALLIAVLIIALLSGGGGDDGTPIRAGSAGAAAPAKQRVTLAVRLVGTGGGSVQLAPGVSCSTSCKHEFAVGQRLTPTAEAADGSEFTGWDDACSGDGDCSFAVSEGRSLTATFDEAADDGATDDGACGTDEPTCTTPDAPPPAPADDCADGKDNDGDGLTDAAQDPGCDKGTEASDDGASAATTTPGMTTPPPAAADDCSDGKDNDRDGLTDSAQDPDCATGRSESGAATATTPTKPRNECSDGRDNDGDGLTDRAQDPGCEHDNTEA